MTRVMAIDAGESTGVSVVDFNPERPVVRAIYQWKGGHAEAAAEIQRLYYHYGPDVVVGEQFDLRKQEFIADLSTERVNAILDYLVYTGELEPIVWQTPGMAKGLVPDKKKGNVPANTILKRLQEFGDWFYPTGKDVEQPDANDVRDALRHAVYYGVTVLKHRPLIEKGWPNEN